MARVLSRRMLACLRRANPIVETRVEVSAPDLSDIQRRIDQFSNSNPSNAFAIAASGGITIPATSSNLANFPGTSTFYNLAIEDPSRRLKGMGWQLDATFVRAKLRTFTARIQRDTGNLFILTYRPDFQLQIYRVTRTPGVITQNNQSKPYTDYAFSPLLSTPPVIKFSNVSWTGTGIGANATLAFDLSNYGLSVENVPGQSYSADSAGELPKYFFVLTIVGNIKANNAFRWLIDSTSTRTLAGIGTFNRTFWARDSDQAQWQENASADVPSATVAIDSNSASAQGVYAIDLGAVPDPSSTVRAVFERSVPAGTTATAEIATAGATGPWTAIKNGDTIATEQQHYWMRVTLGADAALRSSPTVNAIGVESRVPVDVTVESNITYPARSISPPYLTTEIAQATLSVLRLGRRDFRDPATVLGSSQSPTKLEADLYLTANHPSITRDDWLLMDRMPVSDRTPSSLSEEFTLLSFASKLKRKIPAKVETISTVHVVTSATSLGVQVDPSTPLLSGPYDNLGYYMTVRTTSAANIDPGFSYPIAGSTTVGGIERQLDFNPGLPDVLIAGDVIEVHSGIYNTADASWADADPADVWYDILTNYLGIVTDRIGQGWLPRGGLPPHVTSRAPADSATQAKLKVTMKLTSQEEAGKLLDQLSFIMGGATVEIGGNLCFVQIYPLRAPDGSVTVPIANVVGIFDARDIYNMSTPPGLESRATVVSCDYGVNALAANTDNTPARTTQVVDSDAVNWLTVQDLDQVGSGTVPNEITRWLYNSADEGFYIATQCASQVMRAASTGLRVWTGNFSEAHPEIIQGDVIIVMTDAYTDHDPSTVRDVAGPIAVRGVVLDIGARGTTFSIYVLGLTDNFAFLAGSKPGENAGLGVAPGAPQVNIGFDAADHAVVTVFLGERASSSQIVIGTTMPSDATLLASDVINGTSYSSTFLTPLFPSSATLYGKIVEYTGTDGTGTNGQIYQFTMPKAAAGIVAGDVSKIANSTVSSSASLVREALGRTGTMAGTVAAGDAFGAVPLYDATGANPLIDPVTRMIQPDLLAADGQSTPDSSYATSRKASQMSGSAATGRVGTADARAGDGGVTTPGNRIVTDPLYDTTGANVLLDPETKRIGTALSGPTGIPMSTVETGGNRASGALDSSNKLVTGVQGTATIGGTAASTIERGGNKADNALDTNNRLQNQLRNQMTTVGGLRSVQHPIIPVSSHTVSSPLLPDIVSLIADIAAHTLQIGTASISYNAGSVSLGVYSPLTGSWNNISAYIYANDPLYQGSARSDTAYYSVLSSTGAPTDLVAIEGRYFVGKIVFNGSGGVSFYGNGGGGGEL